MKKTYFQITQKPQLPAQKIARKCAQIPKYLLNPFPAIPGSPPSASSEPMECESVAAAELTREIEEVIESPVAEDMVTRDSAVDAVEGTGMGRDDTRNVDRSARTQLPNMSEQNRSSTTHCVLRKTLTLRTQKEQESRPSEEEPVLLAIRSGGLQLRRGRHRHLHSGLRRDAAARRCVQLRHHRRNGSGHFRDGADNLVKLLNTNVAKFYCRWNTSCFSVRQ